MSTRRRIAVVMAGGSGERFWPLSRVQRPKQLLRLADPEKSLIEQTVERLAPLILPQDVLIATAPHLVQPSQGVLPNLQPAQFLAEPHKKNTAGCLVWVAAQLLAQDPEARAHTSMAVLAADHRITPDEGFRATIEAALDVAESTGGIVTIGIRPDRPETGYGYIEAESSSPAIGTAQVPIRPVRQFREKPDRATAESFLAQGGFLWNSGTFFWTLDTFLSELERVAPELYTAIGELAELLKSGNIGGAADRFAQLPSISIDYALMEKAEKVYVAEAAFEWDDVGSWDALDRSLSPDAEDNVTQGDTLAIEASHNIIVSDRDETTVCLLGVDNLVVVVTDDAVLVAPKERSQEVKRIVERLKAEAKSKY